MLTQLDYVIKANIAISLCLSHRLVNGKFVAKEDIKNKARNLSDEQLADKLKEWNEGKSVWDILEMMEVEENGVKIKKLVPKKEYKQAMEDVDDLLRERIVECAENADGVATETQKAEISSTLLGAAILIHRQYLPLQIQDRFAESVWDMNTQLSKQGMFRTIGNALTLFIFESINNAYMAQKADSKYHWYSALLYKDFYKQVLFNKDFYKQAASTNLKNRYKEYFGIDSIKNWKIQSNRDVTDEQWILNRARRKHIKKFAAELIMFAGFFKLLMPLLYTAADDKDNKDKLLLQLAAYTARRVEWESFNPYRFDDMYNNITTFTAETSLVDKIEQFLTDISPRANVFSTLFNSNSLPEIDNDLVKRGVYKGLEKWERDAIKLFFPYHNMYEQYLGSREKRRYYENKIMQIEKD